MRHLTIEALIDFAEGRLSAEDRLSAEQHIESCATCFAEASEWLLLLGMMKESSLENPPDDAVRNCLAIYDIPKPIPELRQLSATVLFDSSLVAPAGVRGLADCQQILFRAGNVDLHLRVGGRPPVILGQLLQRTAGKFLAGVPVALSRAGRQIEASITDALGEFRFGTAPPGELRLQAELPSYRLVAHFTVEAQEAQS